MTTSSSYEHKHTRTEYAYFYFRIYKPKNWEILNKINGHYFFREILPTQMFWISKFIYATGIAFVTAGKCVCIEIE
jgi:hypothetical protein